MIYFDNNATTVILPEVRQEMLPFLEEAYGNPSSVHTFGNRARRALDGARARLARALHVMPGEIVFCGSGSEANNLAIVGSLLQLFRQGSKGKNVVISAVEHPAVSDTALWAAETFGFEVRVAPLVLSGHVVDPQPFIQLIDNNTVLVSVMVANNETGLLLPVPEVFAAAHRFGALCHTDAVQAVGKVSAKPKQLGADLLSFSAHKCHGPKGVGGLFVRRGVKLQPLIHGGAQENTRRAGTENIAYIVGMCKAVELALTADTTAVAKLRDTFELRLLERFGGRLSINFGDAPRTPNTSSVQFGNADGNVLLIKLDKNGVCASTGAACASGSLLPSKGLLAMGLNQEQAQATLRFSFSKLNDETEVDRCLHVLADILKPPSRT